MSVARPPSVDHRKSTLARGSRWYVTAKGVRNGLSVGQPARTPASTALPYTSSPHHHDHQPLRGPLRHISWGVGGRGGGGGPMRDGLAGRRWRGGGGMGWIWSKHHGPAPSNCNRDRPFQSTPASVPEAAWALLLKVIDASSTPPHNRHYPT